MVEMFYHYGKKYFMVEIIYYHILNLYCMVENPPPIVIYTMETAYY